MSGFEPLGLVRPEELVETRLNLHYAAQLAAATAVALGVPQADDSHTSLAVVERGALLVGRPTETPAPVRVGVDVPALSLRLLDESLIPIASFPLEGRTLTETFAWLSAELSRCAGVSPPELRLPSYDLPRHPIASNGRFEATEVTFFEELAHWFGNAAFVLEGVRATHEGSGPVLLWPHHFDVATLITLDEGRSINVGMSPGDDTYSEPYWYVAPWPHPSEPGREELDSGHWHTSGFMAAVLLGGVAEAQVASFIDGALAACRKLLDEEETP